MSRNKVCLYMFGPRLLTASSKWLWENNTAHLQAGLCNNNLKDTKRPNIYGFLGFKAVPNDTILCNFIIKHASVSSTNVSHDLHKNPSALRQKQKTAFETNLCCRVFA